MWLKGLKQRRRGARRGAAAVELAIVLPFLLALLLGMIEIARAMMVYNALTTAAREGVRAGVVPNGTNSKISTAVTGALTEINIPTGNSVTTVKVNGAVADASTAATGANITVEVSVPYADVKWIPVPRYLGGGRILKAKAIMRRE